MSFRIENGQLYPGIKNDKATAAKNNQDFQRLLQETIYKDQEVKLSSHAKQRLEERNISLSKEDMDIIQNGMNKLEQKGARESLMIYKDYAFIASISNRTIITSMKNDEIDVITNIDSTIILK